MSFGSQGKSVYVEVSSGRFMRVLEGSGAIWQGSRGIARCVVFVHGKVR